MSKLAQRLLILSALAAAIALCLLAWQGGRRNRLPGTATPYQAVALMNGQLFFGRLDAAQGGFIGLRDVFYLQTRQNPQTQAMAQVLVKRGGEAHGPDRMLVNRDQVLLIEPVKPDSQIGRLIAEQDKAAVSQK
jgi:hypothetical protein